MEFFPTSTTNFQKLHAIGKMCKLSSFFPTRLTINYGTFSLCPNINAFVTPPPPPPASMLAHDHRTPTFHTTLNRGGGGLGVGLFRLH